MKRSFIEMPLFSKRWKELGLSDDELFELQDYLLKYPDAGVLMKGTGGIRKLRLALENKGKSGSIRVCYTDVSGFEIIYLITAFSKKEKENLICNDLCQETV